MNKLLVLGSPVPGRESDYHDYYAQQHVPDILRIEGVVSARRYAAQLAGHRGEVDVFATEIEVEGDPRAVLKAIAGAMGSPSMPASDAVDSTATRAWVLTDRDG